MNILIFLENQTKMNHPKLKRTAICGIHTENKNGSSLINELYYIPSRQLAVGNYITEDNTNKLLKTLLLNS